VNATQALHLWQKARRWAVGFAILCGVITVPVWAWSFFSNANGNQSQFLVYTVAKSDLPIVVTERGNLESQVRTEIRCEVENSSVDRGGNFGTQIIFIVPNGSAVKKGDLLVELDSAAIREKLDRQTLDFQRAVSMGIQANAKYENQITQNATTQAEAKLKLELAKLQLEMYQDPKSGEHKLAVDEIDRTIDEARNLFDEAKAALALQKTERTGIETLFKLGYRGRTDLEQSTFKLLQAEDKLASAVNRLSTSEAARQQLETYIKRMKEMTLHGDVATFDRGLKQVEIDNGSKLQQALAAKQEAEAGETKERERLEKLKTQLVKCKIYAPHDGMAVYAREDRYSNDTEISEGISVRERQQILSLPDLSQMQVKTRIHEAVLDQVIIGLPVTVKIDAFPDRTYTGIVEEVAVVPTYNGWGGSGVKTYDCVIRIPDKVENLKPGMTAVTDIHIDRIRNILSIPVTAVVQVDKDNWCYVENSAGVEKKKIQLGRSNDKWVHVTSGVALNDRVVLNPMMVFNDQEDATNEITPDSGAPDMPNLPVEKLAAKKVTKDKTADPKKKRSGPRPAKSTPADAKTPPQNS
jgi:HlyD family secretion protein